MNIVFFIFALCSVFGLTKAQTSARDIQLMNERLRQQQSNIPPSAQASSPYALPVNPVNQPSTGVAPGSVVYVQQSNVPPQSQPIPQQVVYPVDQGPALQPSPTRFVYAQNPQFPQPPTPNNSPPQNTRVLYAQAQPQNPAPQNTQVVYVQNPPQQEAPRTPTFQGPYPQRTVLQAQPSNSQNVYAQRPPPVQQAQNPPNQQVVYAQDPNSQNVYAQRHPPVQQVQNPPNQQVVYAQVPNTQNFYESRPPPVQVQSPSNQQSIYSQNPPVVHSHTHSQTPVIYAPKPPGSPIGGSGSPAKVANAYQPGPRVVYSPNTLPIVGQTPQVGYAPNPHVIYVQNPPVVYAQSQPVVLASNHATSGQKPTIVYLQHPPTVTPSPDTAKSKPSPSAQPNISQTQNIVNSPPINPNPNPYAQLPTLPDGLESPIPRTVNQVSMASMGPTTTKTPTPTGNGFVPPTKQSMMNSYATLMNSSLPTVAGLPVYCRKDMQVSGIRCVVPNGDTLLYDKLSNWATSSGLDQRIFVSCMPGGTVSVPWPMRALNIVSLNIKNCIISDFFKNIGATSIIPDKMIALELYNCTVNIQISELSNLVRRFKQASLPYTKISDCGQGTLKKYIFKDINFDFLSTQLSYNQYAKVGRFIDGFVRMAKQQTCNYPNLIYLDESGSQISSLYHFQLLTANAMFPKMKTYLSSGIGLQKIPAELEKFPKHFPCLEYLDLSSNFLTTAQFSFEFRGECLTPPTGPMYINLRNNRITILPVTQIEFFLDNRVIIDLQGNPINCAIQTNTLRQYATDMAIAYPKYATVLKATPCYNVNETTVIPSPGIGNAGSPIVSPQAMQTPIHPGLPPVGMPYPPGMIMAGPTGGPLSGMGMSQIHPHPAGSSNPFIPSWIG